MAKQSYIARLIKDLAVTFNFTPLSPKEVAGYWKRSAVDVKLAADTLVKKEVARYNNKGEIELTGKYRQFFRRNPDVALQLARNGL